MTSKYGLVSIKSLHGSRPAITAGIDVSILQGIFATQGFTFNDATLQNVQITSGFIDAAIIGATQAAAANFTNIKLGLPTPNNPGVLTGYDSNGQPILQWNGADHTFSLTNTQTAINGLDFRDQRITAHDPNHPISLEGHVVLTDPIPTVNQLSLQNSDIGWQAPYSDHRVYFGFRDNAFTVLDHAVVNVNMATGEKHVTGNLGTVNGNLVTNSIQAPGGSLALGVSTLAFGDGNSIQSSADGFIIGGHGTLSSSLPVKIQNVQISSEGKKLVTDANALQLIDYSISTDNQGFTFSQNAQLVSVNAKSIVLGGDTSIKSQNGTLLLGQTDFGGANVTHANLTQGNVVFSAGSVIDLRGGGVLKCDNDTINGDWISGGVADCDISGTSAFVRDGIYRRDFPPNTILKADSAGVPVPLFVPPNTLIGRQNGAITTIPISSLANGSSTPEPVIDWDAITVTTSVTPGQPGLTLSTTVKTTFITVLREKTKFDANSATVKIPDGESINEQREIFFVSSEAAAVLFVVGTVKVPRYGKVKGLKLSYPYDTLVLRWLPTQIWIPIGHSVPIFNFSQDNTNTNECLASP